jgi:hypothetical protein
MADKVQISYVFTINNPDGAQFSDALHFTTEEWAQQTAQTLQAKKQERYQAWAAHMNAAKIPDSDEQQLQNAADEEANLLAQLDDVRARKSNAQDRIKKKGGQNKNN